METASGRRLVTMLRGLWGSRKAMRRRWLNHSRVFDQAVAAHSAFVLSQEHEIAPDEIAAAGRIE